jgi:exonuclease III
MIIKASSFNVRGLNEPCKINRWRNYIQTIEGGIDVIMIQEHKLRGSRLNNMGRKLWPSYKCWALEAEHGYTSDGTEGARKGGTSTLLHRKLASLVKRPRNNFKQ